MKWHFDGFILKYFTVFFIYIINKSKENIWYFSFYSSINPVFSIFKLKYCSLKYFSLLKISKYNDAFLLAYKAKLGIPTLVEKVLKGQIQLEKLISHRIPLEKINEGFAMLKTGES